MSPSADEVIVAVGEDLDLESPQEIDASGLTVLAGAVDPHVHFNEPGFRSDWEGWETGSAAAAVGGITTVVEMPLNASPPTVDVSAFDAKHRGGRSGCSCVDFALWGGVVPGNLEQLQPLAERGVIGFKAFMSASGVEDFPASDDLTLYEAMRRIAPLELPLAVHAESDNITSVLAARARAEGRKGVRDYLESRPAVAEAEAIARVIELAANAACPLHIVHVSTARGVRLVSAARAAGVDVTCEVTPHHLILTDEDAETLGAIAKCAPPLRPRAETEVLWDLLARGEVAFVGSDHSPSGSGPQTWRRRVRRVGWHLRRAVDARADADRGARPRRCSTVCPTRWPARLPGGCACAARAPSPWAPTPTLRWWSSVALAVSPLRSCATATGRARS